MKEGRKEGKPFEWTLERIRETYEKVAMDDISRLGNAQDIQGKSTDFLRRIIAPVDGLGGVTLSYVCPHGNNFTLENYIVDGTRSRQQQKEEALQLVVRGLWRPIRMKSDQQDTGGADRCQCQ